MLKAGFINKKLTENFLSLASVQMLNYILPLVTLPYLVRVLGPHNYGITVFAQSFVQFFIIITDYGFNLSATRQIALSKNDNQRISKIFSSVFLIKIVLAICTFIIFLVSVLSIPRLADNRTIFLLTFSTVIGNVLLPLWLFQGLEKMRFITILNICSKLIFTLGIFIFVNSPHDTWRVPVINGIGFMVSGIMGLILSKKMFKIYFVLPSIEDVKTQLYDGWHVFVSTIATSIYTVSNTFILGILTNNTIVGYYASAEKLINACVSIISPVAQTVFPHVNQLLQESKEKGILFIRKTLKLLGPITLFGSIMIIILSKWIIEVIFGNEYQQSVTVLQILGFLPFLIGLSNIFGIQTMLPLGYKKAFTVILISACILNISLTLILVPYFKQNGTAISVTISELFVTLSMFIYLNNRKIKLVKVR
jgi:polysaccharide transporter, PST family